MTEFNRQQELDRLTACFLAALDPGDLAAAKRLWLEAARDADVAEAFTEAAAGLVSEADAASRAQANGVGRLVGEEATALEKHLAVCEKCRKGAERMRHDPLLTRSSLLGRLQQTPCDQTAWDRFVYLYTPLLRACVRQQGFSEQDLDDIVQDSLIRLFKALPGFDHKHKFRNWLGTIVRNNCWNCWTHRKKRRTSSLPDGVEPVVPDTVEDFIKRESLRHLVRRALQLMKQDFERTTWQACWLTAVKGRPAQEVASRLGMTAAAVYTAKSRVLARLRQELGGFLDP